MTTLQITAMVFQLTCFVAFLYCAARAVVIIATEYEHDKNMHA
jgi:hypothetical protein